MRVTTPLDPDPLPGLAAAERPRRCLTALVTPRILDAGCHYANDSVMPAWVDPEVARAQLLAKLAGAAIKRGDYDDAGRLVEKCRRVVDDLREVIDGK